jgi:tetratricopeptide (TPR) repeat protein
MSDEFQDVKSYIYDAFQLMKEKKFEEAEKCLNDELQRLGETGEDTERALLYSTLGIMEKYKGNQKAAWRHYEKSEKLMPDDPALKIISARLLIENFAQYDTAIKKMKKVLKIAKGVPSFEHQAITTMGLAYLKKGDKKKATKMLEEAMANDFSGIASAENIDFNFVEALLHRNVERDKCKEYTKRALNLAKLTKEKKPIEFMTRLLDSFEVTLV